MGYRISVLGLALVLHTTVAHGATISLVPGSLTVVPGESVTLSLEVSDLGGSLVGNFDVDIGFDPAVLTYQQHQFTSALGDTQDVLDFSFGLMPGGVVNLTLVSSLFVPQLEAIQSADSLVLASVSFLVGALPPGASTLVTIAAVNALGDGEGFGIDPVTVLSSRLSRAADSQPPVVPEPGTWLLLLTGLAASRWRMVSVSGRCYRSRQDSRSTASPDC